MRDGEREAGAKGNPNQAGKRNNEGYKELKAKLAEKFERALARWVWAARGEGRWEMGDMETRRGEETTHISRRKRTQTHGFLSLAHRHYPKTKGRVEFISIATPLTNLYYLNRADSYGLEHTPAHYAGALDKLRPQTSVPGLYVTGQDCASVGIVGALNGGILTAHAIMGYSFWDLVVAKRNLVEDLMAMDKAAEAEGKKSN